MAPTYEDLERAVGAVPGVAEASVGAAGATDRGRLRIRLEPGHDPDDVSRSVSRTLRERFGIDIDPSAIRPGPVEPQPDEDAPAAVGEQPSPPEPAGDGQAGEPPSEEIQAPVAEVPEGAAEEAAPDEQATAEEEATPDEQATAERTADEQLTTEEEPTPDEPATTEQEATPGEAEAPAEAEARAEEEEQATVSDEAVPEDVAAAPAAAPSKAERPARRDGAEALERPRATLPGVDELFRSTRVNGNVDRDAGTGRDLAGEDRAEDEEPEPPEHAVPDQPDEADAPRGLPRLVISDLRLATAGLELHAEAVLEFEGRPLRGRASGAATRKAAFRTVAAATLGAVEALFPGLVKTELEAIEIVNDGEDERITVTVTFLTDEGVDKLVGVALSLGDAERATMRATLDAVNRRLGRLLQGAATAPD